MLSDGEGNLLNWHISTKGLSREEVQEKYNSFFADIKAGKHEVYDSSIIGMDGKRGACTILFWIMAGIP